MYKIIGQPINFRYIGGSSLILPELSPEAKRILKIAEIGLNHGYQAASQAFEISKSSYYIYLKQYTAYKAYVIIPEIKTKCPHNTRKANWHKYVIQNIINSFENKLRTKKSSLSGVKRKLKY